jgi:hypothetical protein
MGLLIRNSFILAKTEATYGTDAVPTSSDAVKIVSIEVNPITGTRIQRNLLKGFLGADRAPLANEHSAVTITFEWSGSGAAATAPRFAPLLLASGMNEVLGAEITGSATAGGAGSLTLADLGGSNPATDAYLGFPIEITSGTGSGHKGIIVGHDGATRVVTVLPVTAAFTGGSDSQYKISARSVYQPVSTFGANSSATLVAVKDANVHRIVGFRGSPALNAPLNEYGTFTITGVGRYQTPTPKSAESFSYGNQAEPVPVTPTHTKSLQFQGYGPCSEGFTFDWANSVSFRSLIGCSPQARITDRPNPNGTLNIENPAVSAKNYFSAASDNSGASDGAFVVQQGVEAGNSSILFMPRTQISGDISFSDSDGIDMMNIPFTALPKTQNDETRLVFF